MAKTVFGKNMISSVLPMDTMKRLVYQIYQDSSEYAQHLKHLSM